MIDRLTFGSVCSGIEASQLAFAPFGYEQLWSSEIAEFPSKVLDHHYPNIPNLGDMTELPDLILNRKFKHLIYFVVVHLAKHFRLQAGKMVWQIKEDSLQLHS